MQYVAKILFYLNLSFACRRLARFQFKDIKTHTPMRLLGNRPKTLVHQSSLQAEVPPYPTTLATLGLEDEVYQKFLNICSCLDWSSIVDFLNILASSLSIWQ